MPFVDLKSITISANHSLVSVVPSISELLVDFGLEKQIFGVTRFCIHPYRLRSQCKNIGGTKQLKLDEISSLKPDFIFANKEENLKDEIEFLAKEFNVILTDINDLKDNQELIEDIATASGKEKQGSLISQQVKESLKMAKNAFNQNVYYAIWHKPTMLAGKYTFIDSVLTHCGLNNICEQNRYPEVDLSELKKGDLFLLSSEPYPFKAKHLSEYQSIADNKAIIVDGEVFSWYGSRLKFLGNHILALKAKLQ